MTVRTAPPTLRWKRKRDGAPKFYGVETISVACCSSIATASRWRWKSHRRRSACLAAPENLQYGAMATPTAPAPNHSPPLARATRRELTRADVNAELTKLLMYGHGSMLVKIHDHRVADLECTTRLLEGKGDAA
jgi:hypothetical protein